MKLILFYNSACKFCNGRAQKIKRQDTHDNIILEDIAAASFMPELYDLTMEEVESEIHCQFIDKDGYTLATFKGYDAIVNIYLVLGHYKTARVMRAPIIQPILRLCWKIVEWIKNAGFV